MIWASPSARMQQIFETRAGLRTQPGAAPPNSPLNFESASRFVRRRYLLITSCGAIFLAFSIIYLVIATPKYTSTASLLVDSSPAVGRVISELVTVESPAREDSFIYSQLEILRSDAISAAVAEDLKLTENEEFLAADRKLSRTIWRTLTGSGDGSGSPLEAAVRVLQSSLGTSRVQRTRILQVAFTHPDKSLAAAIAQQYAVVFVRDRAKARSEAMQQATMWLQNTLDNLRQQAVKSDREVETYKAANGLMTVSGQIVSDQLLLQLNDQLVNAKIATENARTKYNSIVQALASNQPDTLPDGVGSPILSTLRERYLEAVQALVVASQGETVLFPPGLDAQARTLKDQILQELKRIAASQRNTLSLMEVQEKNLRESVRTATSNSVKTSLSKVELRELERNAENHRALYFSTLKRLQESRQQESFPVIDLRIFQDAPIPSDPSSPRKLLVITVAIFGGALFGFFFALFRELLDDTFRNTDQVRERLGLPVLGLLPDLVKHPLVRKRGPLNNGLVSDALCAVVTAVSDRSIQQQIVIGVVSALPNEGSNAIASALATYVAQHGKRTMFVGKWTGQDPEPQHRKEYGDQPSPPAPDRPLTVVSTPECGFGTWFERDLRGLGDQGPDVVIVNLPPLVQASDIPKICEGVHGIVLVLTWGRTSAALTEQILQQHQELVRKTVGVILSEVDFDRLAAYEGRSAVEYLRLRAEVV